MSSNSEIHGVDEIIKKLQKFPERIQKNVVAGAIRAGAASLSKEMKRRVPKGTGKLKKSIGVVKRKTKDKNLVRFSVAPQNKKGGFYARFIEFGTSKMSAKPFMRPAFDAKGEDTVKVAQEYIKKRLDKELAKI